MLRRLASKVENSGFGFPTSAAEHRATHRDAHGSIRSQNILPLLQPPSHSTAANPGLLCPDRVTEAGMLLAQPHDFGALLLGGWC